MILTYNGDPASYEIEGFRIISDHVLEIIPADNVKLPVKTTGFKIQDFGLCDYSSYSTVYRLVNGNPQYSDNGEVWIEPTKDIVVDIVWEDNDNAEGTRPNAIKADVFVDGEKLETVTLNEKNHWRKEYIDIPVSKIYSLDAKEIDGYTKIPFGSRIVYSDESLQEDEQEEISKDEQIERLTNMVNELLERVNTLESNLK